MGGNKEFASLFHLKQWAAAASSGKHANDADENIDIKIADLQIIEAEFLWALLNKSKHCLK